MKTIGMAAALALLIFPFTGVMPPRELHAADVDKIRHAGYREEDDAVKAAIKADKARIDEERNAILEDGRQIRQARKAKDNERVAMLNEDIKKRKAAIRALKDDINRIEGAGIDYGSGARRRAR